MACGEKGGCSMYIVSKNQHKYQTIHTNTSYFFLNLSRVQINNPIKYWYISMTEKFRQPLIFTRQSDQREIEQKKYRKIRRTKSQYEVMFAFIKIYKSVTEIVIKEETYFMKKNDLRFLNVYNCFTAANRHCNYYIPYSSAYRVHNPSMHV